MAGDRTCDCACASAMAPVTAALEPPPPNYALLFHLLLSFVLVAYVRWHNVGAHTSQDEAAQGEAAAVAPIAAVAVEAPAKQDESRGGVEAPVSVDGDETDEEERGASARVHAREEHGAREGHGAADERGEVDEEQEPEGDEQGADGERAAALRRANAKYLTMLKVGMPRSVVEHKMRMEGADASALDALAPSGGGARLQPMQAMTSSILRPPSILIPPRASAARSPVAEGSTARLAAFRQMAKVGVPRHVVALKMAAEGLDPRALDRDPTASASAASPRSVSSAASTAPSSPDAAAGVLAVASARPPPASLARAVIRKMQSGVRKKLHWTTTAALQRRDSLWSRVHARAPANRVAISTETIQWMERLFVKAVIAGSKARRRRAQAVEGRDSELSLAALAACEALDDGGDDDAADASAEAETEARSRPGAAFLARKVYVTLLDRNKSQNIAIVLARVKRGFPELVRELSALNPDALAASALQTLLDMWPDGQEQAALDAFRGDVSSLATAEQFLLEAQKLPRMHQRLRCLRFKMDFAPRVEELRESMGLVIRGVAQVVASDAFALVLEYIYHLGNLLNFGDGVEYTATVKSVSISSLAKLSFTKAFDGRVTFLQYLVQSIERDAPHLARFGDEIALIRQCSRVSVPNALAELSALKTGVRMLEAEAKQPPPPALAALPAGDPAREAFTRATRALHGDATALAQEMNALGDLRDQLERGRRRFLDYFEEDAALPLDELLGFIATFADEFAHERAQLLHRPAARARVAQRHSL